MIRARSTTNESGSNWATRLNWLRAANKLLARRARAEALGTGHQTMINAAFPATVAEEQGRSLDDGPVTAAVLHKVPREEIRPSLRPYPQVVAGWVVVGRGDMLNGPNVLKGVLVVILSCSPPGTGASLADLRHPDRRGTAQPALAASACSVRPRCSRHSFSGDSPASRRSTNSTGSFSSPSTALASAMSCKAPVRRARSLPGRCCPARRRARARPGSP